MSTFESEYYEREETWEGYQNNPEDDKRAMTTIMSIPEDSQIVLDIGCGVGSVTNQICKPFVVGMDLARTPLKSVKKHKIQGSVNAIPIKTNVCDTIIITEVLEHLSESLFKETLKEIERLDPKYILLSVPYDQCLEAGYCRCENCGNIFHLYHHYRSFKPKNMGELFEGYDVINVTYLGKSLRPNKLLLKLKHRLGLYCYIDTAICNKCGSTLHRNKSTKVGRFRIILEIPAFIDYLIKV
jgi:ubiquinone/menaquinone biosynthesis C-methylase UbiE